MHPRILDANPSDNLYHYQPLPDEQSFRLIDLLQGQEDDVIELTVSKYSNQ